MEMPWWIPILIFFARICDVSMATMRTILLTSGTTVVGLLPLLIQFERVAWQPAWLFGVELPFTLHWMSTENQDIWENLALSTVGGLVSSTLFLLLAMPALYYFSVRFGWWIRRLVDWVFSKFRRPRTEDSIPPSDAAGMKPV